MCADIVVIGAGPVGLWTAIQIKKRRPETDIQIYERYTEYKRSHVLKLEHRSMLFYAKNKTDIAEKQFFKEVTGSDFSKSFKMAALGKSHFIRTNDLEAALKNYAAALGIQTTYDKINSPEDIISRHPECPNFIGADGAHSKIRTAIMGQDAVNNFPLQYVVEIKYEAQGSPQELSLHEHYKTNKMLTHMAFEYVGREKNGITPVSLRFFVDEETYKQLPEASFKEPLKINDSRIPESLKQDIKSYLNVRRLKANESFKPNSEKMSKLTLSLYKAKKFATSKHAKNWFLVGDSAMGVPYFRSLNAGFIIGSQLAFILTRDITPRNKIKLYNACQPLDTAWEFTYAKGKDIGLQAYDSFRQVSAKLPWEFVKWGKKDKTQFKQKTHRAFWTKRPPK